MPQRHAILATAGHVDHGKSMLVKVLTGTDPDRLPEEKARGLTIDLGFAQFDLSGNSIGIVDVPGHRGFVRNMVAGVGAVDLGLLVVAADDGWMPQTEEHLQILVYLGVEHCVVALSKADLVQDITGRIGEIRGQLEGSPYEGMDIIPVSAQTGEGLGALKQSLVGALERIPLHEDQGKPRLAVDRTFTLQGIGTVVTGTLTSGTLQQGQIIVSHPGGKEARIRAIQSHNREQSIGMPGTRTALNLAGLSCDAVPRGSTITLPKLAEPIQTLDIWLERSSRHSSNASVIRNNTRVRVHHGTGEYPARVLFANGSTIKPCENGLAQLRLEKLACVWLGDRVVIRNWQGTATIAGGVVIDTNGDRKKFRNPEIKRLYKKRIASLNDPQIWIETQLRLDGISEDHLLLTKSNFAPDKICFALKSLVNSGLAIHVGHKIVLKERWDSVIQEMSCRVEAWHTSHPEKPGLPLEELRALAEQFFPSHDLFQELTTDLCGKGFNRRQNHVARNNHQPVLPDHLKGSVEQILEMLRVPDPPARKHIIKNSTAQQALKYLVDAGQVVELGSDLVLGAAHFYRRRLLVKQYLRKVGRATTSELRVAMDSPRRIAIPLLEKMDGEGITIRNGDLRQLRKS